MTDTAHEIREAGIVAFAADENAAAGEVVVDRPVVEDGELLPVALDAVQNQDDPGATAFEKGDAKIWEAVKDPVIGHRHACDRQRQRMVQSLRAARRHKGIEPEIAVRTAVHAERAVEISGG